MRRETRTVRLGNVLIGGDQPVAVQGMTKVHTSDVAATVAQIRLMVAKGCEVVRVAVPREEDARAIRDIRKETGAVPLVADVHFDHRLALAALDAGADGVRINPGNMRDLDPVAEVVRAAADKGACIRIGVNSGSIRPPGAAARSEESSACPEALRGKGLAELMAEKALEYLAFVDGLGFHNVKLSLKASDVPTTIRATRLVAERSDAPLHLGVTAAGPPRVSIVKSAIGIGTLLSEGIGDTVRVSMTGSPVEEIAAAWDILDALELRRRNRPRILSCPTCGRCDIDLVRIVEQVERRLPEDAPPVTIALMGCVVNGPGEAADADVGLAGGKGFGFLFSRGKEVRRVGEDEMVDALIDEVMKLKR